HDRFRHMLDPRGLLIYNSSMVKLPDEARNNQDQQIRGLDAMDMAGDLGNELVANVILLGGFIAITGICRVESMEEAITTWLKPNKASQIELNLNALHKGVESVTADA
ncbi:MAG: 2-oxoacid:acceptor oxidoreductase family protein, partial [Planctomycetota bacterium]